jgi:hypothetical protein
VLDPCRRGRGRGRVAGLFTHGMKKYTKTSPIKPVPK